MPQLFPPFESFIAIVALEYLLPSVNNHVPFQVIRYNAGVVALVTLVGCFSCMLSHHMYFQAFLCWTGVLTHRANVSFFSRMNPCMSCQISRISRFVFTLVTAVWFFSAVFQHVRSQMSTLIGWKAALCALLRFYPCVNQFVPLQMNILAEWFVARCTSFPPCGFSDVAKGKRLGAQVATFYFFLF